MSQSKSNNTPRVARGPDKQTVEARVARSGVVDGKAKNGPIWAVNQDLAMAGLALIQAGVELEGGDKLAATLEVEASSKRQEAVSLRITWDDRFRIYAASVELWAVKPEDVTNLGCLLLDEASYKLVSPLGLTARYDLATSEIRIVVRKPPGNFDCYIEISPNPATPGSYQELPGKGAKRALAGYAPGVWSVRAAMVSNDDQSDFTPPVLVMVP
jgi:hypothetical protein